MTHFCHRLGLFLFLIFHSNLSAETSHSTEPTDTAHRETKKADTAFAQWQQNFAHYVQADQLKEALGLTCKSFHLDCRGVNVSKEKEPTAKATTDSFTNSITIYKNAFRASNGDAHMGWLAALIEHENVHRKQSQYVRWIGNGPQKNLMRNRTFEAELELVAWTSMLDNVDRFHLTCFMVLEIKSQIYFYQTIMDKKGRGPLNEEDEMQNYSLRSSRIQEILKGCQMATRPAP